jgi:hypothetical protein
MGTESSLSPSPFPDLVTAAVYTLPVSSHRASRVQPRPARFVGDPVTHPHTFIDRNTLPSYQDLRFALVTCGGMMSLGLLTRSFVRVVISFLFNFIHLFNDTVLSANFI